MTNTFFYTLSLQQSILGALLGLPSVQQGVITSAETADEDEAKSAFGEILRRISAAAPATHLERFENSRYVKSPNAIKLQNGILQLANFTQDGKVVGICHLCMISESTDVYSSKGITLQ